MVPCERILYACMCVCMYINDVHTTADMLYYCATLMEI